MFNIALFCQLRVVYLYILVLLLLCPSTRRVYASTKAAADSSFPSKRSQWSESEYSEHVGASLGVRGFGCRTKLLLLLLAGVESVRATTSYVLIKTMMRSVAERTLRQNDPQRNHIYDWLGF